MYDTIKIFLALLIFAAGAAAGHYHGKATVYENLYTTADHMLINPVAMEKLK
jgi:hypothetical protein